VRTANPKGFNFFPAKKFAKPGCQASDPSSRKVSRARVMVFGDSNAYRPANGGDCWPAMLQRLSGETLWVINESCDGRTTRYDTGECNGLKVIENKIKGAGPLDGIILALGTNDIKSKYGPPDAADIVEGIEKIIQVTTRYSAGVTPVVLTPPPLGNVTSGELANAKGRIPSLAATYRLFGEKHNIPLIDIYETINIITDLEKDSTHLNVQGRKKIAIAVWNFIKDLSLFANCSMPEGSDHHGA
jgi:lysophospholipase L1-like esterase